jgi:hypothetical protein
MDFTGDILRDGKVVAAGVSGQFKVFQRFSFIGWSGEFDRLSHHVNKHVLRLPDGREFAIFITHSGAREGTSQFVGYGDPPGEIKKSESPLIMRPWREYLDSMLPMQTGKRPVPGGS